MNRDQRNKILKRTRWLREWLGEVMMEQNTRQLLRGDKPKNEELELYAERVRKQLKHAQELLKELNEIIYEE